MGAEQQEVAVGGIGTERREVEFEPLPEDAPGGPAQEPRELPVEPQPEREPAPA